MPRRVHLSVYVKVTQQGAAPVWFGCHLVCNRFGAHWRHLSNTIEPSMCCGDAALCQITPTTCYVVGINGVVMLWWMCAAAVTAMENASDRSSSPLSTDEQSLDDKAVVTLRFITSSKVRFDHCTSLSLEHPMWVPGL